MSNPKHPHHSASTINTQSGRRESAPLDYNHPYESMRRYAELLALRHNCPRTRYSYYRAMRLLHEHFGTDPANLGDPPPPPPKPAPLCPCCKKEMVAVLRIAASWNIGRDPPPQTP